MSRCHDGVVVLPSADSVKLRPKSACRLFNWMCQQRRKSSPAVSPPKVRMTEISWSRLRKCEDGQLATRPPPKMRTAEKFPATRHDPESAQWKGSIPTQTAYSQVFL